MKLSIGVCVLIVSFFAAAFAPAQDLAYVEGEDALATNFAREPLLDYGASGSRLLQLNREPQAAGTPFFAEYSFRLDASGSWTLWLAGTPPGPRSELTPSYASPFILIVDGGAALPVYREDVSVVEASSHAHYWFVVKTPLRLEAGDHTVRIEVAEKRRHDTRYFFAIDALFLLDASSALLKSTQGVEGLPARFPKNLADRSIDSSYKSIAEYEGLIQAEPKERRWYLQLASVYGMLGDSANALRILSRGRLIAGDDPRFSLMAARNRIWSGDATEGLRLYREYLAAVDDPAVWAEAAKIAAWLAKYPESLALYRDALAKFPDDLNLLVNFGLTYLWAGKVADGEALLEEADRDAFVDPSGVASLAEIFKVNGYPDKQRDTLIKGIDRFPDEAALYALAVRAALEGDERELAARLAARGRARFPDSPNFAAALDAIEAEAARRRESLDRYTERLAAAPDDLELRRELVRAYYWNGRLAEAVAEGENIIVNKQYRIIRELERDLLETWRLLDTAAVMRARAAGERATALAAVDGLESAYAQWKKDAVDEPLARALVRALAGAELELIGLERRLAALDTLAESMSAEADAVAADAELIATFGSWSWKRDRDLASLTRSAARGDELAAAVLDRIQLIEGRPELVVARAAAADPTVAERARSLTQARLWINGEAAADDLAASVYFTHGPLLLEPSADAGADAEAASDFAAFDPETTPTRALETAAAIRKAAADTQTAADAVQAARVRLLRRADRRLVVRMYQHDLESVDERRELADVYLRLERSEDAVLQLTRVLAVAPGDVYATFNLARAYEIGGDWSRAMEKYKTVYSIDPRFENIAGSFNRLARAHADTFSASVSATVDNAQSITRGVLEYEAGGTSLVSFGASYRLDSIRVHSSLPPSIPSTIELHSLDATVSFNLNRFDLSLSGIAGGTLRNALWSTATSYDGPFEPDALGEYFAIAPRIGAAVDWDLGPAELRVGWKFDQITDTFLPGRDFYFQHEAEGSLVAYFEFPPPGLLLSAGARAHATYALIDSPFTDNTNRVLNALGELNASFRLADEPKITATVGAVVDWEDAELPGVDDYYAPDSVFAYKGGLELSSRFDASDGWAFALSVRAWGGLWSDADESYPLLETGLRAEIRKGDTTLFLGATFARTGDARTTSYWEGSASLGARIAVPDYIIP